ncbi:1386_t:CDS:2 [Funneliformis caledonium]|uniref:1386_t:CDS:1 n=1 Tax=Funneliformis caledonium TaxID=1117310 RepID=A0A9N9CBX7_9GLOM|nr:1386_t:CDS:2 [Funneliformis caledonium]
MALTKVQKPRVNLTIYGPKTLFTEYGDLVIIVDNRNMEQIGISISRKRCQEEMSSDEDGLIKTLVATESSRNPKL